MFQHEVVFMRSLFCALACAIALCGCQSIQTASPTTTSFDAAAAGFIKKKGEAKIEGHAFWRDDKGGTTNAAGEIVRLVPVTAYSRERFAALYRGQRSIPANQIAQATSDPQYAEYTRTTRAESSGKFEFEDVAPGEYFVVSQVRYKDKDAFFHLQSGIYNQYVRTGNDGGAMFETVTVTGKEEKAIKLVLTNDR
jgi:hypothetical protein